MNKPMLAFAALCLLFAQPAKADPAEISDAIAQLTSLKGQAYLDARERLIARGAEALQSLEIRRARATYSEQTWREDVTVEGVILAATMPGAARPLFALEGLAPRRYLSRRRPEPEVQREIARLKIPAAALFELELHLGSAYPFAKAGAYPATLSVAERTALREKEARALRFGVIAAIAASKHPARAHLLAALLVDPEEDILVRRIAALELPRSGARDAGTRLTRIAEDRTSPAPLASGAVASLGHIRTAESMKTLSTIAESRSRPELRRPAIAAIGALATTWIPSDGDPVERANVQAKAARFLVDLLLAEQGAELEDTLVEALSTMASSALQAELERAANVSGLPDGARARAERAATRVELSLRRAS